MDKELFGARVKAARRKARLTSDALAEVCDCTPVSIRQIESGARLPSLPKLITICNALEVTPDDLLMQELFFPVEPVAKERSDQRILEIVFRLHKLSSEKVAAICSVVETLVDEMERLE